MANEVTEEILAAAQSGDATAFRIVYGELATDRPGLAWDLHCAWPEAEFRLVNDAGHSLGGPAWCTD